jgi:hypothetical protein
MRNVEGFTPAFVVRLSAFEHPGSGRPSAF